MTVHNGDNYISQQMEGLQGQQMNLAITFWAAFNCVGYSESKYRSPDISRTSLRLSLCACAVTSSIIWEATDAISWNSCYVYACSCALNMFKTIEGAADCEIWSVIRFLNARNVLPSKIHHQICQVYGDNAMSDGMVRKWFRCSMKDERTCTMKREVGVHLC